jgi:molybdenum cofactor cytidylyltransferase
MSKEKKKIAIVLEAAGDAKRYGSNKLLVPLSDGRPMIRNTMDDVLTLDVYKRVLVTQYEEIVEMAADDFDSVINNHPELGISLSMQLGIEAAGDADAYMFCVCDQPDLTASTMNKLINAYLAASENSDVVIASISWQGQMSNPKIFSSVYREELMSLSGDIGGRQIIKDHMDNLILVEADSEYEVADIDTPADLKKLNDKDK